MRCLGSLEFGNLHMISSESIPQEGPSARYPSDDRLLRVQSYAGNHPRPSEQYTERKTTDLRGLRYVLRNMQVVQPIDDAKN